MHTHVSFWEGERNAFVDSATNTACPTWPAGSSPGCSITPDEITAVTNQWVNSYRRLISGYEAPVNVSWARTTALLSSACRS